MAWGSLASNQWVSFTDAQTSGFTLKPSQSHVTSDQWMTKDDILNKYHVDSSPLSGYASNQWIPKVEWYPSTLYYSAYASTYLQRNNCSSGYTGGWATYEVDAGSYTSYVDQATANSLATGDVSAYAQSHINGTPVGGLGTVSPGVPSCTADASLSCVYIDHGSVTNGDPYIPFEMIFANVPTSGSFTVTIVGLSTGHSSSKNLTYASLTGTYYNGGTDTVQDGGGYSDSEDFAVMFTTFNDGTYEHQYCGSFTAM